MDFHTVYVMVDNRELANHKRRDPSLPHWQLLKSVAILAQAAPGSNTHSEFSSGLVAVDLIHLFFARCLLLAGNCLPYHQP